MGRDSGREDVRMWDLPVDYLSDIIVIGETLKIISIWPFHTWDKYTMAYILYIEHNIILHFT